MKPSGDTRLNSRLRIKLPALALLTFLLAASGIAQASAQAVTPPARGTSTASPTVQPSPSPTPVIMQLQAQLYFSGLGKPPAPTPTGTVRPPQGECTPELARGLKLPALVNLGRTGRAIPGELQAYGRLCVFGVPFEQGVEITIRRPDGTISDQVQYTARKNKAAGGWILDAAGDPLNGQSAQVSAGIPIISLGLDWQAGLPSGEWQIDVKSPQASLESRFKIPPLELTPLVQLGRPPAWYFPRSRLLGSSQSDYIREAASINEPLKPGATIKLYGANFTPGSVTPIGLYQDDWFHFGQTNLVQTFSVQAGENGAWEFTYTHPAELEPGWYDLINVLNPKTDQRRLAGPRVSFTTAEWQPCPGGFTSRLVTGRWGKVLEQPPLPNSLRLEPNRSAQVTGKIQPGEHFKILDGPQCSGGWVWWFVETPDGRGGWTSEGKQGEYWLSP